MKTSQEKKRVKNDYFTNQTQAFILMYNQQENPIIRQSIYVKHIQKAFLKIATSLCSKYKIRQRLKTQQVVIQQCISSMVQKMPTYLVQRGRAFTYFSIIAKHSILAHLHKGIKYNDRHTSIDQLTQNDQINSVLISQSSVRAWQSEIQDQYNRQIAIKTMNKFKQHILTQILPHTRKKNQILVCEGILQLISHVNILVTINRKTILLYLREITNLSTQVISSILNKLGIIYFKSKEEIIQTDIQLLKYTNF